MSNEQKNTYAPFSAKELYMMNGGNKLYIYKDGFADVYEATEAEEAEWEKEVINNSLVKISEAADAVDINAAIENLLFHKHPGLEALLRNQLNVASPVRQVVLATALWSIFKYEKSFDLIISNLLKHRTECLNRVFLSLNKFKDHTAAKKFIVNCFEGDDEELLLKANITLGMWAYSGIAAIRNNDLPNILQPDNRNEPSFKTAIKKLKEILEIQHNKSDHTQL